MFQYYLRKHGLFLSWVGTGRLIFSLNYSTSDFEEFARRFTAAAAEIKSDGWWWTGKSASNRAIRRSLLKEMLARRF